MMAGFLAKHFRPEVDLIVGPNRVTARSVEQQRSATIDAPFSCEHLNIAEADFLEHAIKRALHDLRLSRMICFPNVTIKMAWSKVHPIERKILREAALNAGASKVLFDQANDSCEAAKGRAAYLEQWQLTR